MDPFVGVVLRHGWLGLRVKVGLVWPRKVGQFGLPSQCGSAGNFLPCPFGWFSRLPGHRECGRDLLVRGVLQALHSVLDAEVVKVLRRIDGRVDDLCVGEMRGGELAGAMSVTGTVAALSMTSANFQAMLASRLVAHSST
ncbi:hypothetical protein ACQEV2_42775 [Streptomyces sp. CA-251387]|uniref:hypothetical protein n=1 Tax=Streptomyces sp. CA-251387 TaxID=3240064 RepID=UPI003D8BA6A5